MIKFNVYVKLKSPIAVAELPLKANPVECENLPSLLDRLKDILPNNGFVSIIGLRVEEIAN